MEVLITTHSIVRRFIGTLESGASRTLSHFPRISDPARIIDVLIIMFVGLVSITTWFRGDFLIQGFDFAIPPDRIGFLTRFLHIWDTTDELGKAQVRNIIGIAPYGVFLALSEIMGLSLSNTYKILFYTWFTLGGVAMYFLARVAIKYRYCRLTGLIAALFYMMNPWTLFETWPRLTAIIESYACVPVVIALIIIGIKKRKGISYILFIALIWWLLGTHAYISPPFMVFDWLKISTFFLLYVLLGERDLDKKFAIRFFLILSILWGLLNAYWLIPAGWFSRGAIAAAGKSIFIDVTAFDRTSFQLNSTTVLGALRQMRLPYVTSFMHGDPRFPWIDMYLSPFFVLLSFLAPILAFYALLIKPKQPFLLFLFCLAVFGIFMSSGASPPFDFVLRFLTDYPALLRMMRAPDRQLGPFVALGYALPLGYTLSALYHYRPNHTSLRYLGRVISLFLVILLIGVYMWPFWSGDVIRGAGEIVPSMRVKIPHYYYTAARWLQKENLLSRIYVLPMGRVGYSAYSWEHGVISMDRSHWAFPQRVISRASSPHELPGLTAILSLRKYPHIDRLLSLMNSHYLLFHQDTNWTYIFGHPYWISDSEENFEAAIDSLAGVHLAQSFGQLDFYENKSWQPLYIYGVPRATLLVGGLNELVSFIAEDGTVFESPVFLTTQHNDFSTDKSDLLGQVVFEQTDFMDLVFAQLESVPQVLAFSGNQSAIVQDNTVGFVERFTIDKAERYQVWSRIHHSDWSTGTLSLEIDYGVFATASVEGNSTLSYGEWLKLGDVTLTPGQHSLLSQITYKEQIPATYLVPEDLFIAAYRQAKALVEDSTLIYSFSPAIQASARFYSGQKTVIEENETPQRDRLTYSSQQENHFIFPSQRTEWNSLDSTLVYIFSGETPLIIDAIETQKGITNDFNAWWEDGWMGMGTQTVMYPLVIPSNQRAIIQIPHETDTITLHLGLHKVTLPVYDGRKFSSFDTLLGHRKNRASVNVYIARDGMYRIAFKPESNSIYEPNIQIDDVTIDLDKTINYEHKLLYTQPVLLSEGQHRLDMEPSSRVFIVSADRDGGESVIGAPALSHSAPSPVTSYQQINPGKYKVRIKTDESFVLVFSENYHPDWQATINGQQIEKDKHLIVNGYANGWKLDATGEYEVTLEFKQQRIFYTSAVLSIVTLLLTCLYTVCRAIMDRVSKSKKISSY